MFAYIRGKLVHSSPSQAVIDTHGIGYLIYIPANVFPKLPQIGSDLHLYTSFIVRELSQTLFGFLCSEDKEAFEILLGVTGIGPKLALSLIGHLSLSDLQSAIKQGNCAQLSRVPGIGKKTAERLIIELRDKLNHLLISDPSNPFQNKLDPRAQQISDAMGALISLGYNQQIAQKAIKKSLNDLPESIHLAELITYALKHI